MAQQVKNLPATQVGSIPGSGRSPGEGNGNPLFFPEKSHGQRKLAGYSPCGCKKWDMTEQLSMHAHLRLEQRNLNNLGKHLFAPQVVGVEAAAVMERAPEKAGMSTPYSCSLASLATTFRTHRPPALRESCTASPSSRFNNSPNSGQEGTFQETHRIRLYGHDQWTKRS